MAVGDTEDFAHVFRFDRYDSICRNCFKTVGSAVNASDLVQQEQYHACESEYLPAATKVDFDHQWLPKSDGGWQ